MAKKIRNGSSFSSMSTKIKKVKKMKKFNDQLKKKKKITDQNYETIEEEKKLLTIPNNEKNKENNKKIVAETKIEEEMMNNRENEEKQQLPTPALAKNFEIMYESSAIYTGGKVLFSQCNKYMFTLANYVLHIFDLEENKLFKRIEHENEEIANFAISPQKGVLATFSNSYLIRIYDYINDKKIYLFKVQDFFAFDLTFDSSGRFLSLGTPRGFIKVFDMKKNQQTHEFKLPHGGIKKLFFHPEFRKMQLICVCEDGVIKLFDLIISKCLKTFNTNLFITAYDMNKDGDCIFLFADNSIHIFDINQFKIICVVDTIDEYYCITHLQLSNKLEYLIYGGENGIVKALDLKQEEKHVIAFDDYVNPNIIQINYLPKLHKLAVITGEQNIIFYHVKPQNDSFNLIYDQIIIGYNDEIIDVKYQKLSKPNPIQTGLILMSTNSNILKTFDPVSLKYSTFQAHSDIILSVDFVDNYLLTGSKDKQIKLWNYKQPHFSLLASFTGHLDSVNTISLSPKTTNFFISGSADKSIKIWNIENVKKSKKLEQEEGGEAIRSIFAHEKDINVVKFAPNEKIFASGSQDKSIKIWDAKKFNTIMNLAGHKRGVWDISFSQFEKILASAGGDGLIKVWNLEDGNCISTLEGHTGSVLKVSFICFGLEIISGGADGLLKLWNFKKSVCVNTFEKHKGKLWSLDVSQPDKEGKQKVLTGGNDSIFCIWTDVTSRIESEAQAQSHSVLITQQKIYNCLRSNDHLSALRLSFDSNMPRNFRVAMENYLAAKEFTNPIIYNDITSINLIDNLIEDDSTQNENKINIESNIEDTDIRDLILELLEKDGKRLFSMVKDFNATAKYCWIAQKILHVILKSTKMEIIRSKLEKETVEALEKYGERHMDRVKGNLRKSFYLDFVMRKIVGYQNF